MNKDWPGRPKFAEAYLSAYFASRQWVQAVRRWVANEPFWARVRQFRPTGKTLRELRHDIRTGATGMSFYAGHWQGQGGALGSGEAGPGGSLPELIAATKSFFESGPNGGRPSAFRRLFERVMVESRRDPGGPTPLPEVRSSRPMQQATEFVRLQIRNIDSIDKLEPPGNGADFFSQAGIAGQQFLSGSLNGFDDFDLERKPHFPFTFFKAVGKGTTFPESIHDLRVELKTSGRRFAGTNDDVFLRINDQKRFQLDKPLYDDFERGDRDTYVLPIDTLVAPLTRGEIRFVQIEKSKDGVAGGWRLEAVKLIANGRVIYENRAINRTLENNNRTLRAPGFAPSSPSGAGLPVWFSLTDDDIALTFGDDRADIHPHFNRRNVGLMFRQPLGPISSSRPSRGGVAHGGRARSSNEVRVRSRVSLVRVTPPPPQTP
jgi:hypothetical protein